MRFRAAIAFVVVAACAVSLTGCSAIDNLTSTVVSATDKAALDTALGELKTELDAMPEVGYVTTTAVQRDDLSYRVLVSAETQELGRDSAVAIGRTVSDAFSQQSLSKHHPAFSLFSTDRGEARIADLPPSAAATIDDDFAYWWDLNQSFDFPVGISIAGPKDAYFSPGRVVTADSSGESFAPLRDLPVPDGLPTTWVFGAFTMKATVISEELEGATRETFVDEIDGEEELQRLILWEGDSGYLWVNLYFSLVASTDVTESHYWAGLVPALRAIVESASGSVSYADLSMGAGTVHLGECPNEFATFPADEALQRRLARDIPDVAASLEPGFCPSLTLPQPPD